MTAESQIENAKDACEKLKRKRSSLVGAFVSTHGRSIEDVDKSIMEAKSAMMELTQDLAERSQRWRQIEMLTGVSIVTNPGIGMLQRLGLKPAPSPHAHAHAHMCVCIAHTQHIHSLMTPSPSAARWSG